jgi:hypothetical protein
MKKLQCTNGDGVRPGFWLGGRKYTLFKIKHDGPWYVGFRLNGKPTCRSCKTTDSLLAINNAQDIVRAIRDFGFTRTSMSKALTQPRGDDSDVRGLLEAFEVQGYWYCVERREDRSSYFVRFRGLDGKQITYSTGSTELELAKADAGGFIKGYRRGLIAGGAK